MNTVISNAYVADFPVKSRKVKKVVLRAGFIGLATATILFIHSISPENTLTAQNPTTTTKTQAKVLSAGSSTPNSSPTVTPAAAPVTPAKKSNSVAVPTAPACSVGSNPLPSALNISGGSGLQKVIDSSTFYQVNGYNASEVQNQIFNCTPVSEGGSKFAASTNYMINWRFNYNSTDGFVTCTVTNATVGVHVAQVYPNWNSSPYATAGYDQRWDTFMTNLRTHENGHRDLDVQYATKMLNDIQNMPASSCGTIVSAVNAIAYANLDQLNQANEAYDAQTNHGSTQGAVIPSR